MADPTVISEFVLAVAAVVSTATPIIIARRKHSEKLNATTLAAFQALNDALGEDVKRLRARVTELESEVATLNRLLSHRDT